MESQVDEGSDDTAIRGCSTRHIVQAQTNTMSRQRVIDLIDVPRRIAKLHDMPLPKGQRGHKGIKPVEVHVPTWWQLIENRTERPLELRYPREKAVERPFRVA